MMHHLSNSIASFAHYNQYFSWTFLCFLLICDMSLKKYSGTFVGFVVMGHIMCYVISLSSGIFLAQFKNENGSCLLVKIAYIQYFCILPHSQQDTEISHLHTLTDTNIRLFNANLLEPCAFYSECWNKLQDTCLEWLSCISNQWLNIPSKGRNPLIVYD